MVKLYSKKLRSLDELRREKALKKKAASESFDLLTPGPASGDFFPAMIDVVTSKGVINKLFALALPVLKLAGNKVEKNILKRLAIEVLSGYAKWKGTEIGLKALFRFVRQRRDKHAKDKEEGD